MSERERTDTEFAALADEGLRELLPTADRAERQRLAQYQRVERALRRKQPSARERLIAALPLLLRTAGALLVGVTTAAITFAVVALGPLHATHILIENYLVSDPHSGHPPGVGAFLDPKVLASMSTVLIAGVGVILAALAGRKAATWAIAALPPIPRSADQPHDN
jgi:hypothetical protein